MRRCVSVLLIGVLLLAFIMGLGHLFSLRFEQGDMYPPYSSLRSDPMGTKVWFEALERLEHITVERHLRLWSRSSGQDYSDAVIITAGQHPSGGFLSSEDCNALMNQVEGGACWILALTTDPNETIRSHTSDANTPLDANAPSQWAGHRKLGLNWKQRAYNGDLWSAARPQGDLADLDSTDLPWPGRLRLSVSDPNWQVLATAAHEPVMLTRPWGQGTLVVLADSYLLSNEAQVRHRHPEMLSYLIGPKSRVIFNETHLGVSETSNLMTLARRYRLGGLGLGLALTLGLFLWSRAGQLTVNASSAEREAICIQGKDLGQGLESLLQRHLPNRDLLATCIREYLNAAPNLPKDLRQSIEAQLALAHNGGLKEAQCVKLYQDMVKLLQPHRHKGTL